VSVCVPVYQRISVGSRGRWGGVSVQYICVNGTIFNAMHFKELSVLSVYVCMCVKCSGRKVLRDQSTGCL
jgi:hypothetical protein